MTDTVDLEPPAPSRIGDDFRRWILEAAANDLIHSGPGGPIIQRLDSLRREDDTELIPRIDEIRAFAEGGVFSRDALQVSSLFDVIFSHTLCLRLFKTVDDYLGVGTESLNAGDDIFIVSGSCVPLILRPVNLAMEETSLTKPQFKLVGAAYLHGFMKGEALKRNLEFTTVEIV